DSDAVCVCFDAIGLAIHGHVAIRRSFAWLADALPEEVAAIQDAVGALRARGVDLFDRRVVAGGDRLHDNVGIAIVEPEGPDANTDLVAPARLLVSDAAIERQRCWIQS